MALTEDTIVDSIDVLPDGQIQVRKANRVFRDGVEISRVADIGAVVHTAEVIKAFNAKEQ